MDEITRPTPPPAHRWIAIGAILGALGVVTGAFGAHGLEGRLDAKAMGWWHTAVLYHLLHAPVVVLAGLAAPRLGRRGCAAAVLAFGIAIFSGTLYAMALGAPRFLGAITPIGGALLIVGWLLLAHAAIRPR